VKQSSKAEVLSASKLQALLKRGAKEPESPAEPVETLVQSFLLWEAATAHAAAAFERIRKSFVDLNELRVEVPSAVVALLGSRYPMAEERADRLKRSLHAIFQARHKLDLEHLKDLDRRKQLAFLEGLDGMVPFVASRTLLVHFGHASVPLDEQAANLLREGKIAAREATTAEISTALAKLAGTADEARRIHGALLAFADAAWEADAKSMAKAAAIRSQASMKADHEQRVERIRVAAQGQVEVKPAETAKPGARASGKAESRPEAKPESKPVPKSGAKPAAKAPAKPAAKAPAKPAPKPGAASVPKGGKKK
jgi:sulfite reductase alpha subunit-like flavoprotein